MIRVLRSDPPHTGKIGSATLLAHVVLSIPFPFGPWLLNKFAARVELAARRSGNGVGRWSYQRSYSTSCPVSTGMGDVSGFDSRRRHFISVCNQPTRSTQNFILSRSIN